jgi:hypothetical protein
MSDDSGDDVDREPTSSSSSRKRDAVDDGGTGGEGQKKGAVSRRLSRAPRRENARAIRLEKAAVSESPSSHMGQPAHNQCIVPFP